jgi:hypothetical protein
VSRDERGGSKQACCMISEVLEEVGIDREKLRKVRRQLLEGVILLCQWQLDRLSEASARRRRPEPGRKGRRIPVE